MRLNAVLSWPGAAAPSMPAGRAGTKLSDFADGGCLDEHLPATLDLLVLENVAGLSGGPKVREGGGRRGAARPWTGWDVRGRKRERGPRTDGAPLWAGWAAWEAFTVGG